MEIENRIEKVILAIFVLSLLLIYQAVGQETKESQTHFKIATHIGYDFPTYENNTPYIDYEGGLDVALSLDYYYNWLGFGADIDYITNKPKNTYPTENLFNSRGIPIEDISFNSANIFRLFYGIGPNFQYANKSQKFTAEINTRIGFSNIKGGKTSLTNSGGNPLNFHAGYNAKQILSTKGQLKFLYFFNEHFGVNLGGYYLNHFKAPELNEGSITAAYAPFSEKIDQNNISTMVVDDANIIIQNNSTDHSIWSAGVFIGVTHKFLKKAILCKVCKLDHKPHCTQEPSCTIMAIVKDKYSGESLKDAKITLENLQGKVIKTAASNVYGAVVFNNIPKGNYFINGTFYKNALDKVGVSINDFKECSINNKPIEKALFYSDQNFIMKGIVVECNDTTIIDGVDILLRDKISSLQKNTRSTPNGEFVFYLNQTSIYNLQGSKDGYLSNDVEVNSRNFDRKESLFIDFEMCVDPCGRAIKLSNINFKLGKWNIDTKAKTALHYIIRLMKENPKIKVEMSSHTDSRGTKSFNQLLSQKRAQSTVDYIVSQGINNNRIIALGAGETELLNYCRDFVACTEDEHAINRRTEFKIICSD